MASERDRGHLCWWPLIFIKNFRYVIRLTGYRYNSNIFVTIFDLCFIGSVGFDGHLTDSSLTSILFASAGLGAGCSAAVYQKIGNNKQKFFFISIHKPPASNRLAPMEHALAVTVEPFKFSAR